MQQLGLLCQECENILTTDMEWPAYMEALLRECRRTKRLVTVVPIRQALLYDRIAKEELVRQLVTRYRDKHCDGLFLSAVTYQGIRLPIRKFVGALAGKNRPRLVVVDGAQAFNHVPLALANEYCDLLLAGCHKWLRAYHPLGLALCCREATESLILDTCRAMFHSGDLDDPLLSFIEQFETGRLESFSETVNLAPLFTAAAAIRRMIASRYPKRKELAQQCSVAEELAERTPKAGWKPFQPAEELRTGVLLLEAKNFETRLAPIERIRERFRRHGVSLSAYDGGIIRTSLPSHRLTGDHQKLLQTALHRCS